MWWLAISHGKKSWKTQDPVVSDFPKPLNSSNFLNLLSSLFPFTFRIKIWSMKQPVVILVSRNYQFLETSVSCSQFKQLEESAYLICLIGDRLTTLCCCSTSTSSARVNCLASDPNAHLWLSCYIKTAKSIWVERRQLSFVAQCTRLQSSIGKHRKWKTIRFGL